MMADFLSRLLNPNPIMNQSGGASPMPFPQMQPQEMQRPGFGQNFKSNIGPILQALGMGIASGDLGRGAAMLPGLVDNRQQRQAQIQEQQQEAQQRNATAQWFRQKDPEIAAMLDQGIIDGKTALGLWQQKQQGAQPGNQPASIQEYEYAKQNGFQGSFMDFQEGKRGQGVTYGTSPQWIKKPDGGWEFGVIGTDGSFKKVQTPEGLAGPEGVAESRSAGTEQGKVRGAAAAQLPQAEFQVSAVKQNVASIINDPYLPQMTGPVNAMLPNVTGDAARFKSKVEQLKGQAFLGARQALKGGGQITDYEGQRAEAALLRAEMAQNPEDFKQAVMEFQFHMERGLEILRMQAGQGGGGGQDPELEDALKQYGD